MAKYADQLGRQIKTIPPEVMKALQDYWWPGNVRELQNFIERSVILSSGKTLNAPVAELTGTGPCAGPSARSCPVTLAECEREHILASLHSTKWVIGGPHGAAKRLGLKRTTLLFKMAKLGIARQ